MGDEVEKEVQEVGESVDAFGAEFDGENDQMRIYLRIDIKIKIIRNFKSSIIFRNLPNTP